MFASMLVVMTWSRGEMRFDELSRRMRAFETVGDSALLPAVYVVARLDGRSFTRLTKQTLDFERPFDIRFRDAMLAAAEHVMMCGFNVAYAYTQSDELSVLLHLSEDAFGRNVRKYTSILAGEMSGALSLQLGALAAFDCRLAQLPSHELVVDYFRWRQGDAQRNALDAHCYWRLRADGLAAHDASTRLRGLAVAAKHDLLHERGTNFNTLPSWQKRGAGLFHETTELASVDSDTPRSSIARRRRIRRELELPLGEAYDAFLLERLTEQRIGE
jgi:tRNA(His) 5'-end guanylyltransferase